MNTKLSIEDFQIFCTAARILNFSRAAHYLGVTPGYISKRVLALENQLGCRLFHRSTRQVTLTEQGERAYELGMRILDNAEELHDEIMATQNDPRGVLRVSTSIGFGRKIVAGALADFSCRYPGIKLRLNVVDEVLDLAKHKIDLDIRIGDEISPHYIARKLASNYRVLCAAPTYLDRMPPLSEPQQLLAHHCLVIKERDHPVGLWKLTSIATGQTYNVKVSGPLVTNNGEIAVAWALAGRGVILRSIWDVMPHLKTGALKVVLPDLQQDANIWAVYPERLSSSAKIKLCVEHLESFFETWKPDPVTGEAPTPGFVADSLQGDRVYQENPPAILARP